MSHDPLDVLCPHQVAGQLSDECDRLRAEVARLAVRARESEDQLVWLAEWCRRTLGVENNAVIGRDGWPHRTAEVVAKAAEDRIAELTSALRGLFRCSLPRDISGQRFIDDALAVLNKVGSLPLPEVGG